MLRAGEFAFRFFRSPEVLRVLGALVMTVPHQDRAAWSVVSKVSAEGPLRGLLRRGALQILPRSVLLHRRRDCPGTDGGRLEAESKPFRRVGRGFSGQRPRGNLPKRHCPFEPLPRASGEADRGRPAALKPEACTGD